MPRLRQLLQRSCLRPNQTIRRQLMVSFGVSAVLTITLVVLLTCLAAQEASRNVQSDTTPTNRDQVLRNFHEIARNQAAQYTRVLENIDGTVQFLVELVRDRIVGYPFYDDPTFANSTSTDHDAYVPFTDHDTGQQRYPLDMPPLPLDWQIHWNVVPENAEEHMQERAPWLRPGVPTSTASASWFVQGQCQPDIEDPFHYAFVENCTTENNDMSLGGKLQPTPTARYLYDMSGDLGLLLKPLYEAQPNAHRFILAFVNDGAGALIEFPGAVVGGSHRPNTTYPSSGCDWLLTQDNPYTGQPLGTPAQVARCHEKGTMVPSREYNPLERDWFRTIATSPVDDRATNYGPFRLHGTRFQGILFGKRIFDRR